MIDVIIAPIAMPNPVNTVSTAKALKPSILPVMRFLIV